MFNKIQNWKKKRELKDFAQTFKSTAKQFIRAELISNELATELVRDSIITKAKNLFGDDYPRDFVEGLL